MELVKNKKDAAFVDSLTVSKAINYRHVNVMKKIKQLINRGEFGQPFYEEREYRSQKFLVCILSIKQFIHLMTQFQNNNIKNKIAELVGKSTEIAQNLLSALNNFDFEEDMPDRFIYAAQDNQGNIKIGISKNPEERIKQINIGNAYSLELIFTRRATKEKYCDEVAIHNQCSRYWLRSEWFTGEAKHLLSM